MYVRKTKQASVCAPGSKQTELFQHSALYSPTNPLTLTSQISVPVECTRIRAASPRRKAHFQESINQFHTASSAWCSSRSCVGLRRSKRDYSQSIDECVYEKVDTLLRQVRILSRDTHTGTNRPPHSSLHVPTDSTHFRTHAYSHSLTLAQKTASDGCYKHT